MLLSKPQAKKLAIVAPAPGNTPTKKPKIDVRPMTGTISLISSLDNLIDPNFSLLTSEALKLMSIFLKIIIKASLMAKVAITNKTKLIPSIKLILPKAKRVMSDNESWPTVAKARPNAVITMAFRNCPLLANAAIDKRPTHIRAK